MVAFFVSSRETISFLYVCNCCDKLIDEILDKLSKVRGFSFPEGYGSKTTQGLWSKKLVISSHNGSGGLLL